MGHTETTDPQHPLDERRVEAAARVLMAEDGYLPHGYDTMEAERGSYNHLARAAVTAYLAAAPLSQDAAPAVPELAEIREEIKMDLLETAWGIIANVNEGNWEYATPEWKAAAERWRDNYHDTLDAFLHAAPPADAAPGLREAAEAWCRAVVDPPNLWASEADFALMDSVFGAGNYDRTAENPFANLAALAPPSSPEDAALGSAPPRSGEAGT